MLSLILTILALLISLLGWLAHRARKRRMQNALGHKVNEYEMNSINSWMQVAEKEENK